MNIYSTTTLSKPEGDERIPVGVLSYMRARLRQRLHSMILQEFEKSGLTQADLARRLGKSPRIVHRWLSTPENMRLSTLSDLVFGISGGEPSDKVEQPLEAPPTNQTHPAWLIAALDARNLDAKSPSGTRTSAQNAQNVRFLKENEAA